MLCLNRGTLPNALAFQKVVTSNSPEASLASAVNAGAKKDASEWVKLKLTVAYDGTAYQGWQTQKIGTGVQEIVERALRKLFPNAGPLCSSSRTDTGVHALGMVAHVEIPAAEFRIEPRKVLLALNAFLPEDIRVLEGTRAPVSFHARYHAKRKQYQYTVWNHPAQNPLLRRQAWHVPLPLDVRLMKAGAKHFLGRHDFQSFAANPGYSKDSTTRTIFKCDVKRAGPRITIVIEGDGFLYKMCRGIAGTLVQVGRGKHGPEEIRRMLAARDRRVAGMTAPAHGLVLWKVYY